MAQTLELPDREFKMTMVTLLSALMEKVNDMQVQVGNVSGEMKILRKTQKREKEWQKQTRTHKTCETTSKAAAHIPQNGQISAERCGRIQTKKSVCYGIPFI